MYLISCTKLPFEFLFLLVDVLQSLSVSIVSSQQNIIRMNFTINASNILYCFEQVFVAYVSTHLLLCSYSLIRTSVTPNILCKKIKSIVLTIWSRENFKLKYLRIKLYCFFIAFWPPVPKELIVLQWGRRQIVQQDINSHSVSHFIF